MIKFENVSKTFKKRPVLDQVSLHIKEQNRIALVGSNGAGKTTLIRCLLGEYNYEGSVEVLGKNPRIDRRDVLKRIGFVPQLPPPLKMPVGELIRFSAGICGSNPAAMEDVATKLGLDIAQIRSQSFVKLSGGQKQKLLIGIALGRECDVLMMDEPAANLDPEARHIFFNLLAERQKNTTMILSSHRLDEVASLVNRVVELDRGKIVLDDYVADQVDMDSILICRVTMNRDEASFANALKEWKFKPGLGELTWEGQVAGPDRLRFLGVISRYAAVVKSFALEPNEKSQEAAQ
ncbi:MAG: ABC transporter ATP-binding protein [Alphaproteobacteria bacterium]|nr:ABC transporter ATP-binding protein [Rhodospirillales bacterium]MCW9046049.1 ABC transporter ATP-binding protein [Alphaproteobacteria bacterium]